MTNGRWDSDYERFQNASTEVISLLRPTSNKCLFPVHSQVKFFCFFSEWANQYPNHFFFVFFFCLSSYGLMLNMISTPFVFVLLFFTFIWTRLLVSFFSLLQLRNCNNEHTNVLFISRFSIKFVKSNFFTSLERLWQFLVVNS